MSDFENQGHNDNGAAGANVTESGQGAALSDQSEAILKLLTDRGLLQDADISDEKIRQAQKDKRRSLYHNTQLMLRYYRDISWALECFPADISDELERPMSDLDEILELISAEIGMGNERLEGRMSSVQKSRLLLNRFNEALTVLRQKPGNGELMYQLVYLSYIVPEMCMNRVLAAVAAICAAVVLCSGIARADDSLAVTSGSINASSQHEAAFAELLPIEVSQDPGKLEIRKVYELEPNVDPGLLPRDGFERGGVVYACADILREVVIGEESKNVYVTEANVGNTPNGDYRHGVDGAVTKFSFADFLNRSKPPIGYIVANPAFYK